MQALREAKGEAHALIALGSLAAIHRDAQQTVRLLSALAEACIRAAVRLSAWRGACGRQAGPSPIRRDRPRVRA